MSEIKLSNFYPKQGQFKIRHIISNESVMIFQFRKYNFKIGNFISYKDLN